MASSLRFPMRLLAAAALLALAACGGLADRRQPVEDFYQSTSQLVEAESRLLAQSNAVVERSLRLRDQANYVAGQPFRLSPPAPFVAPASANVRLSAVRAVNLYAQKLLVLSGSEANKRLDTYSLQLGKSVFAAVPQQAASLDAGTRSAVLAAFDGIANIVLDEVRYRGIVEAARDAQPHLVTVADLLAADAPLLAGPAQVARNMSEVSAAQILEKIRQDRGVSAAQRVDAYERIAPLAIPTVSGDDAAAIGQLATAILRANASLAADDKPSFAALARDARRRGGDVVEFFKAAKAQQSGK